MAEFRWDILKYKTMDYVVRYPKDYQEGEKRPILIYLHGAGGRTDTIPELQGNRFFAETVRHADFPFICIAPLCHERSWYDVMETLKGLVRHIAASDYADAERLYLMGSSMGRHCSHLRRRYVLERIRAGQRSHLGIPWRFGRHCLP